MVTVVAATQIPHLAIELSLQQRFFGDDKAVESYGEFLETFGPEVSLAVVGKAHRGTIWDDEQFTRIGEVTRALAHVPGIERAVSVAALPGFDIPRQRLKLLPLVRKRLVSSDDVVTAVLVEPSTAMLSPTKGLELVGQVQGVARRNSDDGISFGVAGPLALQSAAIEYSRDDLKTVTAIAVGAILIVIGIAFRSWRAAAAPLAVAATATVITLGVLAAAKVSLSQFALIAVPVFVGLSVLDGVHIVHAHLESTPRGDPETSMTAILAKELVPCFWTSLTTLIGFAVLLVSPIAQVRSIGLVMAIGVPLSFVLSFTLLPSLMELMGQDAEGAAVDPFIRWSRTIAEFIERRRRAIVITCIAASIIAGAGIARLDMSLDFPHLFRSGDPIQDYHDMVDDALGGSASFELMLRSQRPQGFKDPEMIKRVASLSQALRLSANVATTVSFLDLGASWLIAQEMDIKQFSHDPAFIDQLIGDMMSDPGRRGLIKRWVTDDFDTARIQVILTTQQPHLHALLEKAIDYLSNSFGGWFEVKPTGFAYLYKSMERVLMKSFRETFTYALIGVLLAIMLVARSAHLGHAAVLANLLPIVIVLGVMGWVGEGISVGVVILPAVGLGLIADDTIHFMIALRRAGGSGREAVEQALRQTGWPIVLTQLILLAAFGSLVASHFASNVTLGIFMSLLLVIGLVFDLLFIPALILLLPEFTFAKGSE